MNISLTGQKIAFLVANGFHERDLTEAQRVLQKSGAHVRIVSMDNGLVNSWNDDAWGLYFAADQALSSALAADFEILVVPGGQRSIEKLKLTAHTRRFVRGFMDAGKAVVLMNDALQLLEFTELAAGRTVSGPPELKAPMQAAGASWADEDVAEDMNLMTGYCDEAQKRAVFIARMMAFLGQSAPLKEAA
jgi:protease I